MHLGMYLDTKFNFQEHKVNKAIGLLRKLQAFSPHRSLVTVSEVFIRSHFDYGDIIYEQTYYDSFQ